MESNFRELMERPLESRCEELKSYVYEQAEQDGRDSGDVCILGFYTDEDLPDVVTERKIIREMNLQGKIKNVAVELRTEEGWETPHLHVLNEYFNYAVRLDKAEYFIHPGAPDTFHSNKQKKIFDKFMSSLTFDKNMTKWEFAKTIFNEEFGPAGHPLKCNEKPDYTKL